MLLFFCAYEATLHHCFRREDAHKAMSKEREEFRRTLEARLAEYHKSKEAYKKVKAIDLMFRTVWNRRRLPSILFLFFQAWDKAENELQELRDERERERDHRLRALQVTHEPRVSEVIFFVSAFKPLWYAGGEWRASSRDGSIDEASIWR